jgi:hypothetical protein
MMADLRRWSKGKNAGKMPALQELAGARRNPNACW